MQRDNSEANNIAALAVEEQKQANRLAKDRIELDRLALEVSGKQAHAQRTYAISAVIAAIAAVIAAIAGITNLIVSINGSPHA